MDIVLILLLIHLAGDIIYICFGGFSSDSNNLNNKNIQEINSESLSELQQHISEMEEIIQKLKSKK